MKKIFRSFCWTMGTISTKDTTMNTAYDMDGYELFAGDYVACGKKLYRINKIQKMVLTEEHATTAVLELIHVKSTKIVKRKGHEVERLN